MAHRGYLETVFPCGNEYAFARCGSVALPLTTAPISASISGDIGIRASTGTEMDPFTGDLLHSNIVTLNRPVDTIALNRLRVFVNALDYNTWHSSAARRKVHGIGKWASKVNRHLITVKKDVASLQTNLESRMIIVEEEMIAIKVRFDTMDTRMDDMERRLNGMEKIVENMEKTMDSMKKKMDDMEKKMDDIGENTQLSLTAVLIMKPVPLSTPLVATDLKIHEDLTMVNLGT